MRQKSIEIPSVDIVEVFFGESAEDFFEGFSRLIEEGNFPFVFVVTDGNVWASWGSLISRLLSPSRVATAVKILPPGEATKNLDTVRNLWEGALKIPLPRKSLIVAFGGGVVGDIAGFFASTLYRGVEFWQVPTTLLAQVDASFGGKTGVDTSYGKNLIGTFYNASRVFIVRDFLKTLPIEELLNGMAEVVKSSVIGDPRLFNLLKEYADTGVRPWEDLEVLERALKVKIKVVVSDPFEKKGTRYFLNLGHTLGHALEGYAGYSVKHGFAVSVGMVFAAKLSREIGLSSRGFVEELEYILSELGLPVRVSDLFPPGTKVPSFEELRKYLLRDKKRETSSIKWVMPVKPGKVILKEGIPQELIEKCYSGVL